MSDDSNNNTVAAAGHVIGSTGDDDIRANYVDNSGNAMGAAENSRDKVNGNAGNDTIVTEEGEDLAAGDMVGNEWQFVDGKWVYDPSQIKVAINPATGEPYMVHQNYNDVIMTGAGDDIAFGNGGDDRIIGGAGDDRLNGGAGNDIVFGGTGNDILNLEGGDDYAEGGAGDDIINGGAGNDLIYGDNSGNSILSDTVDAFSLSEYVESGLWSHTEGDGWDEIAQAVDTDPASTYEITFDLAANINGGFGAGSVEVFWNGESLGTVSTSSGAYSSHSFEVSGAQTESSLSFRLSEPEPDPNAVQYDFSGPVASYDKTVNIGGEEVTVDAFAPGQAKLYQVIHGQFNVFDVEAGEYTEVGADPGFKINSIGYNQEDDLIYGVAKSNGFDSLGNEVSTRDLVMIDASGATYRVGEAHTGSYTGDFDDSGNLWAFNGSLNEVRIIDVDSRDADGNPEVTIVDLPDDMFHGNMCDISYNSADGMFYSVMPPSTNGGAGKLYKMDMSNVQNGGDPIIQTVDITGTLYDGMMANGMAKGAYGAVFLDAEGTIYYGLNRGDHDLGTMGVKEASGGVFKVHVDWEEGQAYSEFMSDARSTGSNDGAMDPRAGDAFAEVDTESTVLLRNIEMSETGGGNDDLRGGTGDDTIFGGEGTDTLNGGDGQDTLSGDEGKDIMQGGAGNDIMYGGEGNDRIMEKSGDDLLDGGAGKDYLNAGSGSDTIYGGEGADKIVGGHGSDVIEGGAGNDHMWGGNWWKDGASDTFVASSGSGKDMIHDFEADKDIIDLSAYGIEFSDLQSAIKDKGWATEIDLSSLKGGTSGDKLVLKSVDAEDLDESNFIL